MAFQFNCYKFDLQNAFLLGDLNSILLLHLCVEAFNCMFIELIALFGFGLNHEINCKHMWNVDTIFLFFYCWISRLILLLLLY